MKMNVCIKAALRRPFRTLFTLLMMAAITYSFTAHIVEYVIVQNETNYLGKFYRPIGKLDSENLDVTKGRELISKSPYVDLEDMRRCSTGVLRNLYNADIDGFMGRVFGSYQNDVVFWGELLEKK